MTRHEVDQLLNRASINAAMQAFVLLGLSFCWFGMGNLGASDIGWSLAVGVGAFVAAVATGVLAVLLDVRRPWAAVALASLGGLTAIASAAVLVVAVWVIPFDGGIASLVFFCGGLVAVALAAPGLLVVVASVQGWRAIRAFATAGRGGFEPVLRPAAAGPSGPRELPPSSPPGPPA